VLRNVIAGFALLVAGASTHAADVYKVDMTVSRGGVVVGKPSVRVVADKVADLTMTPPRPPETQALRVSVSVAPGTQAGTIGVHLMIFDWRAGEWTLRSEPDVVAWTGKVATVDIAGGKDDASAAPIHVALKVTPELSTSASDAAAGT
jgi:hypothetical protein